jgi:hypothetical protein
MPPQLPPTINYSLAAGANQFLKLISLSSTGMTTQPAFAWGTNQENWFSTINTNLSSTLKNAASLTLTLIHNSPATPDATLVTYGNQLATTTSNTFQLYAKGLLSTNDWLAAPAAYNSATSYYYEETGGAANRIKLLIEVSPTDATKIGHLIWFSPNNTMTGYMSGKPDGSTVTLSKLALSSVPTTGYYYKSP